MPEEAPDVAAVGDGVTNGAVTLNVTFGTGFGGATMAGVADVAEVVAFAAAGVTPCVALAALFLACPTLPIVRRGLADAPTF
jgi:hypothetical protein